MNWNYRIIERGGRYGIHEVFYDNDGRIMSWTEEPIDLVRGNAKQLRGDLKHMVADMKRPVLHEAELLKRVKEPGIAMILVDDAPGS